MRKKRLLLLVSLPPPMHGSNVINEYVIRNEMLKRRFDLRILPLRYASSLEDIGRLRLAKLITCCRVVFKLGHLLRRFRPDVVYFVPALTGLGFYRECVLVLILKVFRTRIIYHLHGKGVKERLSNPVAKELYKWFFRDAGIIHLSPLLFDDIGPVVRAEQVAFLPNGIDVAPQSRGSENGREGSSPRILFLANLVVSKGPLELIDAAKVLKERGVDFVMWFVGNPSRQLSQSRFKAVIAKAGLEDRVSYLGPKYGAEKGRIMSESDLFVFPTYYERECFPLVLLEAMACGLPIVSTPEGAIPEIVEDGVTGVLVPPKNSARLADRIEALLGDGRLLRTMGEAGRRRFRQRYTLAAFNIALAGIFDAMCLNGIR